MVKRDELNATIEKLIGTDLIAKARVKDIYANGVQLNGTEVVNKIALGVTMTLDFMKESVAAGADFLLSHHGVDLTSHNVVASRFHPGTQKLLRFAVEHNLTIAGYHYSLDAQPEFGNNASLIKEIGAKSTGESYYDEWGYVAEFVKPIKAIDLAEKVASVTSHDVFTVYGGPEYVKRIGVCSGGAKPYDVTLMEIIDKKLDAHFAGEAIEASVSQAQEVGYNYYAAGHYATEVFGVQGLGKKLKAIYKDKLQVEFIDIPNPL